MKKSTVCLTGVLLIVTILLSACNLPSSKATVSGPDLIMTAAVQTVEAQLTQPGPLTLATLPALVVTETPQPAQTTATPLPPTATIEVLPTAAAPTATTASTAATSCNKAQFVTDLSYPDGSEVPAGTSFIKTWRLKNTGSCTWDSSYSLVFVDKNAMGGPASQQLTTGAIHPGDTVDVSVTLKAPSASGSYEGDWMLSDGSDNLFGIGGSAQGVFWVKINSIQGSRISMASGSTAVTVNGHIGKKGRVTYVAGAKAGQTMIMAINTPNKRLYFEIQAPDGTILLSASDQQDIWYGYLPQDGDYLVSVVTTGDATDFSMTMTIPVRITFQTGATSASASGEVGSGEIISYVLKAMKNQTMTVTITSPDGDIYLNIYGLQDGKTYIKQSQDLTTASFNLPSTQDYVVQAVSTGNSTENFTISFKVTVHSLKNLAKSRIS